MIVSSITDRLGNQMFQYASAKGIAAKLNTELKLDVRYYKSNPPEGYFYGLDAFCLPQDIVSKKEIREYTGLSDYIIHKVIRRVYPKHQMSNKNFIYQERFFQYDDEVFKKGPNLYLRGYWQSYKYFEHIRDEIIRDFSFKNPIDTKTDVFASDILNSNSVCISVRRGDHFWHPVSSQKYGRCDKAYYDTALRIISEKEKDLRLFIFSDEIEWCEANLKFDFPTVFVKKEPGFKQFDYFLQLITLCKHFVIPVSTFPWWGAWLSKNPGKMVVAPKVWFTDETIITDDLFPANWIRI